MEKSGAESYIYAKAAGLLRKSWISEKAVSLFNAESLSSLWNMLFSVPEPAVPELLLANKIEIEAVKNFVKDYSKLLKMYDKPDSFLTGLLQQYDVENLKALISAVSYGEENHPHLVNLEDFRTISYEAWPNLKKITAGSPYEWVPAAVFGGSDSTDSTGSSLAAAGFSVSEDVAKGNAGVVSSEERQKIDFKLDLQMLKSLWNSVCAIKGEAKSVLKEYFSYQWAVKNLIWAMRLRVYYKFSDEKIIENLYYVGDAPSRQDPICAFAFDILSRRIDSYDDWESWRFIDYLNPRKENGVWALNPTWVEQRFRSREFVKAKKLFHQYPMSEVSLAMFYCLKKQELNCIRSATEALRLGTNKKEAMYVAGITGMIDGEDENVSDN